MSDRLFRFATIEFGTFGLVRILGALRNENRVFQHAENRADYEWVTDELRECFCPASEQWRNTVVGSGLDTVERCISALSVS